MAKKPSSNNLEQAMSLLIQIQAAFLSHLTAVNERFARIESELGEIKSILLRHEQVLQALPEAIRQKIGFEPR